MTTVRAFGPPPVFVDDVLFEPTCAHLFLCCFWLQWQSRVVVAETIAHDPQPAGLKHVLSSPLQKRLADSYIKRSVHDSLQPREKGSKT